MFLLTSSYVPAIANYLYTIKVPGCPETTNQTNRGTHYLAFGKVISYY